ncbi:MULTISPECIES: alpha/beta family hydrolase [Vibrio]|uniref:Alpha/beta hydrolase n=1 Tax=Vibrio algicola TaxID=2662262 RepID=A0A5Q0TGI7_9VIBR|nr:alpha/beta family hydrolase [Vibrio algicola]MBD1575101.1 alpha/beta hydrolase [Vibrio sp. S11_S32]
MDIPVLVDGNEHAAITVLLAHGAGAGMDHEFMTDIAQRLACEQIKVVRFNFPYMAKRAITGKKSPPDRAPKLLAAFEALIAHYTQSKTCLFLAGKSMGGRMASHLSQLETVRGVMCLGFPFHPPKQLEKYRGEHLACVTKPMLIVQGERDTFGTREECSAFVLSSSIALEFIPDGDHGFKPRVRSGFTETGNRELAVTKMRDFIERNTGAMRNDNDNNI